MSKCIRNIMLMLLPMFCLCVFACAEISTSPPTSVETSPPAIEIKSEEPIEDAQHPIDAAFEVSHPEPDGSTASMIEYAAAYRDVWYAEALRIASVRQLSDALEAEQIRIAEEAAAVVESYRLDPDVLNSPYGTATAWAGTLHEANAWRAWAIANQ